VDVRAVAAFSQDFTVGGGALGRIHAKKICDVKEFALKSGCPIWAFMITGGADSGRRRFLSGYGQVFFRKTVLPFSGVVRIGGRRRALRGRAAYSPAADDFHHMVKGANMFICGPESDSGGHRPECTMEEIGSAMAHASVAATSISWRERRRCGAHRKELLSYLAANNVDGPAHTPHRRWI